MLTRCVMFQTMTKNFARKDTECMESIHPGEILLEEFLKPMGLSQYRIAKDISVPPRRISEIIHAKRAITADTALRLARYFGMSDRLLISARVGHRIRSLAATEFG